MLQQFAATHNVKMVAVSIGGNDFNFGSIVQHCVTDFLTSPTWWKDYCKDDSSVTANFTSGNVSTVRPRIATAYQNVRTAMRNAGYADTAWTMLVQNYPSPLPNGSGFRYSESGYTPAEHRRLRLLERRRRLGERLRAADHQQHRHRRDRRTPASPTAKTLDLATAFNGRRLCENTVGPLRGEGPDLLDPGRRRRPDRVGQPDPDRLDRRSGSPYYVQESLHPNYWAQLATRSCVRQAYNGGAPRAAPARSAAPGCSTASPG